VKALTVCKKLRYGALQSCRGSAGSTKSLAPPAITTTCVSHVKHGNCYIPALWPPIFQTSWTAISFKSCKQAGLLHSWVPCQDALLMSCNTAHCSLSNHLTVCAHDLWRRWSTWCIMLCVCGTVLNGRALCMQDSPEEPSCCDLRCCWYCHRQPAM